MRSRSELSWGELPQIKLLNLFNQRLVDGQYFKVILIFRSYFYLQKPLSNNLKISKGKFMQGICGKFQPRKWKS